MPLLYQGDCIGVLDLSTDQRDAFDRRQGGVRDAARQPVRDRDPERPALPGTGDQPVAHRARAAHRAARADGAAAAGGAVERIRGLDIAAQFDAARELGGDFHDYLDPLANQLVVVLGDVSGKGVPAALYSAFASELVRSRTFRKRYVSTAVTPSTVLQAMNTILHERQLLEMYCTLCYALFDLKRRTVTLSNSGVPYPLKMTAAGDIEWIDVTGVPLGSFPGIEYDECIVPYAKGDVFLFYSDGVSEAMNAAATSSGATTSPKSCRRDVAPAHARSSTPSSTAVAAFRGDALQNDDITAVAVRAL